MPVCRQFAFSLCMAVLGVGLGACVTAPAQPLPPTPAPVVAPPTAVVAAVPTTVPARPTVAVAVAPTPTFERVREAEPTVAAIQPRGLLTWRDEVQNNDGVRVSTQDLPSLASDSVYAVWLQGKDQSLFLGILNVDDTGTQARAHSLTFAAPDHANLLEGFERITIAPAKRAEAPNTPVTDAVLAGALPEHALVHVRHVLVSIPLTPKQIGFALGLRQQSDLVLQHAQFLRDAVNESNLANLHFHAEHLVNIIEGEQGEHYGDLDGNGKIDNPGDGYGLLQNGAQDGYIKGMADHAGLAASSPDATESIKVHATHVQIAAENTRVRVSEIRTIALDVARARRTSDAADSVLRIVALAQQTIQGVDLDGDELVDPVKGEGGVLTAYQHAQLMAGIPLMRAPLANAATPATLVVVQPTIAPTVVIQAPAPTLVPTVAPTVVRQAPAPTPVPTVVSQAPPRPTEVQITDDIFVPKAVTVPAGSIVVWTRAGTHTHTVTADDGSFDSGLLRGADPFRRTFDTAGVYAYYCDVHGGPGGVAMSGTVIVK